MNDERLNRGLKYHPYKFHSDELSIIQTSVLEKFFWGEDFSEKPNGYKEVFKGTPREFLNSCGLECRRPSDFAFWIATRHGNQYSTLIIEDYVKWERAQIKYGLKKCWM